MELHEKKEQLKAAQAAHQNNVATKPGVDEQQKKQIEAQIAQIEEVKRQLDSQAKTVESERKLIEEQRYVNKL